jgi:hypothetical protein
MPHPSTFEEFRIDALSRGFHEALVREWAAGQENSLHEHPFDTHPLVVRGEF